MDLMSLLNLLSHFFVFNAKWYIILMDNNIVYQNYISLLYIYHYYISLYYRDTHHFFYPSRHSRSQCGCNISSSECTWCWRCSPFNPTKAFLKWWCPPALQTSWEQGAARECSSHMFPQSKPERYYYTTTSPEYEPAEYSEWPNVLSYDIQ